MSFDNNKFEKDISETTASIKNLNKELQFEDASEGFKDLSSSMSGVSSLSLIDNVSRKCSCLPITVLISLKKLHK
jgi:glutaredoxin-related protein